MKRQRSVSVSASEAPTAKKKAGKMTKEEVVAVGGEMMDHTAVAAMDIVLTEWEEWCSSSSWSWSWSWMVGDEQMCWDACWCPFWDVELMGKVYEDMYNDVVWDDDIWDLKCINQIPY
ncbi:hypothetical protein POM88_030783 [Heracleum sosnowskyi]|uniref:Uncharacterized protein n=1 Tax=Heracleum sosnowskyi TaxID=360622 RepID=A0AAD8HZ59_9APIA|nr:hypothetical protein POM88_030783 [Heracleum sosnowskyi]